jgi:hypothetical protein
MQPDTIETIMNSNEIIGWIAVTIAPVNVAICNNTISLVLIIGC